MLVIVSQDIPSNFSPSSGRAIRYSLVFPHYSFPLYKISKIMELLHCALSLAAQCIVIGPICGFVCVCGCVTTITRNCVHQSSPNWVRRFDHLQLIKFWPSCAPGRGFAAWRKFSALPYYSQRLPRWLSGLRHSAHRPERSAGGAGFNPRVGR